MVAMSTLADPTAPPGAPGPPRTGGDTGGLWPLGLGALAALQAVGASLATAAVPVVLAWAFAPGERAPWPTAARLAADLWLVGHGAAVAVPGGSISIVPLGMLLVPLLTCWFAGVRLARQLDPRADAVRGGIGRVQPVTPPRRAVAALVLTYAGLAAAVALLAGTADARPDAAEAFAGGLAVAAVGAVPGVAAWRGRGARAGLGVLARAGGVPPILRDWARPAAAALGVLLVASALLTVVAVVLGWDRVIAIHQALRPGAGGGAALVLAQLLVVPDAVVWAVAYVSGPGFAVGAATAVDPGGSVLGPLPALPLFGALPVPGTNPGWLWCLAGVPMAAGAVGGALVARGAPRAPVTQWATDAAGTGGLVGAVTALLAWLASGAAGPGRMATVGPVAWQVGLAVALEVALGALAAVALAAALRRRRATQRRASPRPS
jgi:hypothetical protein